jgi:uroporphyrinogen-III decarboxylase
MEPELMEKVFERTMEYTIPEYEAIMEATHPLAAWVGGWRTAPYMLSEETFDKFVWPYFKVYTDLLLKHGVTPMFHLDANWNRALPKFLELPRQQCIMALDSATDIRLARKVLGDHMAILGDVPATKLAFGKPQDIRDYVTGVLDDIGPRGYICASGCDVPANAKFENVKAMADAAHEYR